MVNGRTLPERRRMLGGASACLFAGSYAAASVPALPLHAEGLGASLSEIGLLMVAPALVGLLVGSWPGPTGRWGPALGALLLVVTTLLCAPATAVWQLLLLRGLQGLSLAALSLSPLPIPVGGRWHVAGWVVGPLLAAAFAERLGLATAFYVAAGLGLCGGGLLAVTLMSTPTSNPRDPAAVRLNPGAALVAATLTGVLAFLPTYAVDLLGWPFWQAGLLAVAPAVGMLAGGRIVAAVKDAPGPARSLGIMAAAAGAAGLGLFVGPWWLLPAASLLGVGYRLASVGRMPPGRQEGGFMPWLRGIVGSGALAALAGTAALGSAVAGAGYATAWLGWAVVLALAAIPQAVLAPAAPREGGAAEGNGD